MDRQPIAYLASEYPAISHTFIFREVQSLRSRGFTVKTASIRGPEHLQIMMPDEWAESEATLYIKTTSYARAALIHLGLLIGAPRRYCGMLRTALRLTRQTPLSLTRAMAYFAEAGVLLWWMRRERLAHVHVHFANPAATVALIASGAGVTRSLTVHGLDVF